MQAHEVEQIIAKIEQAKFLIMRAVDDIVCDRDEKAELEEWKNEAENAIDEIKAIAERMV